MTGGGLPAEIWARFMKAAHRNTPVASLPGVSSGFFSLSPAPPHAAPPAMTAHRPQAPVRPEAGTMDSWLLDRLFGRR
jgi:membrane peptidoglycan carboxypeptidase